MEKFKQLGIGEGILNAIKSSGFTEPTEIQEKAIPLILAGKDVIGGAATGSGKTLAFASGIIDKVKKGYGIQALIMTPTRELAEQVAKSIRFFSKDLGLNIKEVYGGVSIVPQISTLRYADIVVGTPGRILDHLERRTINLNKIRFLVLDEADRMLDMGFIRDVEKIINACPKERQTLLFSATISNEIAHIAKRHMINPVQVSAKDLVDPSKLYQAYYEPSIEEKFSLLVHLLKLEKDGVVMVFCNTRKNVDRVSRGLYQQRIRSLAIHGGLSQNQRSRALQAFHEREVLTLICTDVAARGLDIKNVSHIYNFDIPTTPSEYIHRIGRTARAGKNGIAISFVCPGDRGEFKQILKESKCTIEELKVPQLENIIPIIFKSNADRKVSRSLGNRGRGGGRGRNFGGRRFEGRSGRREGSSEPRRNESRNNNRGRGRFGNRNGREERSSEGRNSPRRFSRARSSNFSRRPRF